MYGAGISREGEIIEIGVAQNLVEKSRSWYSYKGERIGQGKDNPAPTCSSTPNAPRDRRMRIRAKLLPARKGEAARVRRPRKPDTDAAEADERTVRTAALALLAGRDFGGRSLPGALSGAATRPVGGPPFVEGFVAERLLSEMPRSSKQFIRPACRARPRPARIRAELRRAGRARRGDRGRSRWRRRGLGTLARDARRRRFGLSPPGDYAERARQARSSNIRGFSNDQIRAALARAKTPTHEHPTRNRRNR